MLVLRGRGSRKPARLECSEQEGRGRSAGGATGRAVRASFWGRGRPLEGLMPGSNLI